MPPLHPMTVPQGKQTDRQTNQGILYPTCVYSFFTHLGHYPIGTRAHCEPPALIILYSTRQEHNYYKQSLVRIEQIPIFCLEYVKTN